MEIMANCLLVLYPAAKRIIEFFVYKGKVNFRDHVISSFFLFHLCDI
jgi:hypothetical protein